MQSRETRFVLYIESGERQGERVPLTEGKLEVGRRPECGLVLKDGSVSGKHAELRVAGERVELIDLGSTNGTRVSGHKIEQAFLGHGDALQFGNIRAVLHDSRLAGDAPPPLLEAPPVEPAPLSETGAIKKVSADKVTRSGAGSKRLTVLVVLLLVLAGASFAYFRFLRPGGPVRVRAAVASVEGDLITDGSFEEGTSEWTAAESAPLAFWRESAFAGSGDAGLGVTLEDAGWSLARSDEFVLHPRRSLVATGALRVDDAAVGRFGVELASSAGTLPAFVAWAPARRGGSDAAELELAFDVLGGYDRGRVVVAGLGPGTVAADDVHAVEREPRGKAAAFTEYELAVLGEPGSTAMLVRSGRALLVGFDLSAWTRERLTGWPSAELAAAAGPRGFTLSFPGAPPDAKLRFLALRADEASGESGWAATTGADGYAAHGDDFTRAGVTALLLGSGTELLRIGFEQPVTLGATIGQDAVAFEIALGGLAACDLQLAFGEERAEASALADKAADAERKREFGAAIAHWTELLDRFPFERKLVTQATETRARLVQAGLAQVDELRRENERARFFLLPELFRKGEARALELARQYAGSEVEAEARKTAELCAVAVAELSVSGRSGDAGRLRGVLAALEAAGAEGYPRLVEHVRGALSTVEGDGDRGGKGD